MKKILSFIKKTGTLLHKNKDYFFVIFIFFPDYLFYPALIVAVAILIKKVLTKEIPLNKPLTYLYLAFVVYVFIVALVNQNIMGLFPPLWLFILIMFGTYLRQIATPRRYMKIQQIIASCSIVSFAFNFFDYRIPYVSSVIQKAFSDFTGIAFNSGFVQYPERLFSTFDNPNYYAFVVLIVLLICFNQIQFQITLKNYKKTVFYALVFIINMIALSLTDTRTVYPALAVGLFTILIIQKRYTQLRVISAIAVGVVLFIIIKPDFMPRFHQLSQGFDIRTTIWEQAITFIKESPIFGHGFFSYHHLAKALGITLEIHAHSLYLEPLLSFGFIGSFILLLAILYDLSDVAERTSIYDRPLAISVIMATLCYGFFDIPFFGIHTSLLFVIILALPLRKDKSMLK